MPRNTQKAAAYLKKGADSMRAEQFGIARTMLEKALLLDKDNAEIMRRLARVHMSTGRADEAVELLRRCVKRNPNHPDTLLLLAQAQRETGDIGSMHDTLDKALARDPSHGACLHAKAMGYIGSGKVDQAQEVIDAAAGIANPHPLVLIARGKLARTQNRPSEAIEHLKAVLEDPGALDRHQRSARFELGHCYDALGAYDQAFEIFRRANAGHEPGKILHPESVLNVWSGQLLDALPPLDFGSQRPVFIVGMPRSGTTLTEQVLSAHPGVAGVGECPLIANQMLRKPPASLTCEDVRRNAEEYLAFLEKRVGTGPERVIDKHMGMERTLGLISRMFPRAKVIECRRDPIDSCLSSYFQNFGSNVSYSRDLGQLGRQYVAHRRVMDHWRAVLEMEILVSPYEQLVSDFEPGARRLVEYIGLPFHENCLRFHRSRDHVATASAVQVRSPIYRSSAQRWRNYEKHLGPLIDALGPYAQTDSSIEQGA